MRNSGVAFSGTEATNTVTCPTGSRPLSGGGTTDQFNFFLTDIAISSTSVSVRWESDNNASVTGFSYAWALCAP